MSTSPTPPPAVGEVLPRRFERLHAAERWWLRIGVAMLVVFVSVVFVDALRNVTRHSHGMTSIAPEEKFATYRNLRPSQVAMAAPV